METVSNTTVVLIGVGTVFVGLIAIVVLCYIMSAICKGIGKNNKSEEKAPVAKAEPVLAAQPIANKQEVLAACCAVIAEELGTQANNIKVLSFKRV